MRRWRSGLLAYTLVIILSVILMGTGYTARASETEVLDPGEYFSDADEWMDEFFSESAYWLGHAEIFLGDGQGRLHPDGSFTRQQMALILTRLTGKTDIAGEMSEERTDWKDD